jgi:integrase
MRQGELLALRWDDVDFYTGTLRIQEAKSGEGRSVAMNSVVRAALQAVRREQIQKAREQAKGGREILSLFVFCSHKGRFLHNLAKVWYPALEAAGIEDFRFHDLETHLRVSAGNGGRGPLHGPARRRLEDGDHGAALRASIAGSFAGGGGTISGKWK